MGHAPRIHVILVSIQKEKNITFDDDTASCCHIAWQWHSMCYHWGTRLLLLRALIYQLQAHGLNRTYLPPILMHTVFIRISAQPRFTTHLEWAPILSAYRAGYKGIYNDISNLEFHTEQVCTLAHNCHGKTKNLTVKPNTSQQKPNTSRQNQSYFAFAVKYLVLPWGILFLPWGFWFCRDVFVFAVRFLVFLWQFWATISCLLFLDNKIEIFKKLSLLGVGDPSKF